MEKICHRCNILHEISLNKNLCDQCQKILEPSDKIMYATLLEYSECTLCSKIKSSGFFTGCMIRDIPIESGVDFNRWSCDGNGHLTRPII